MLGTCKTCGTEGCKKHTPQPVGSVNRAKYIVKHYGKLDQGKLADISGHAFEIRNIGNSNATVGKMEIPACESQSVTSGDPLIVFCEREEIRFSGKNDACDCVIDDNGNTTGVIADPVCHIVITCIYLDHPEVKKSIGL